MNDLKLALDYVMSKQHDFYNKFFYQQKLPNGGIHYIVDRKYTYIDAKGNKKSEPFNNPVIEILQTKFKLNQSQIERLTQSKYMNPAIQKIMFESNFPKFASNPPKKVYQNIYSFLSTDSKQFARQISKSWKENYETLAKLPAFIVN